MVKPMKNKEACDLLTNAGFNFKRGRTSGSHTVWRCNGVMVSVPTGHDKVSPGIARKIYKAIAEASKT